MVKKAEVQVAASPAIVVDLVSALARTKLHYEAIADRAGISSRHVYKVMRGEVPNLSVDVFERLAKVAGMQLVLRKAA